MYQRTQIREVEIWSRKQVAKPILALALHSQCTTFARHIRQRKANLATVMLKLCIIFRTCLRCHLENTHSAIGRCDRANHRSRLIAYYAYRLAAVTVGTNSLECHTLLCIGNQVATFGHKIDIDRILQVGQQEGSREISVGHFEVHINLAHNAFNRSVFNAHLTVRIGAKGKFTILLAFALFGTLYTTTRIRTIKSIETHQSSCRAVLAQQIAHLVHHYVVDRVANLDAAAEEEILRPIGLPAGVGNQRIATSLDVRG